MVLSSNTEFIDEEIRRLIQQATEPHDKAFLILLLEISHSLTNNTIITKNVVEEFHAHKVLVDSILNRMRGGWWVAGMAFVVIQAFGFFFISTRFAAITKSVEFNEAQQAAIVRLTTEHSDIVRRLDKLETH